MLGWSIWKKGNRESSKFVASRSFVSFLFHMFQVPVYLLTWLHYRHLRLRSEIEIHRVSYVDHTL